LCCWFNAAVAAAPPCSCHHCCHLLLLSSVLQDENGQSNGCEWLPVVQVGNMMCQELGYEDEPEFEDALKGTFSDFLNCLPHVIKKTENGRLV